MPILLNADHIDLTAIVRPGDRITWGQAGAEPLALTQALMAQRHMIGQFEVFLGVGYSDTCLPEHADCVRFSAYCGSGTNRTLAKAGVLDILPCHYSQFPDLIRHGPLKIDVLLLQLAPPDKFGRFSLSIAHEYLLAAMDSARVVIAEVNEQAPWTYGERYLQAGDIDLMVHTSRPALTAKAVEPGPVERAIATNVASLIGDGATLQFGLGAIPDAVLEALRDRRDLGVHSGTIGDNVAKLISEGVITNARKRSDCGITIAGVMMGTEKIYDFAHRNRAIQLRSTDYTHHAEVLTDIDHFVALNSAIEVDLTGQINAEVAGGVYMGAMGGALDFLRGARRSRGGLPIIALPSMAGKHSRIVTALNGPVSTPRCDASIIVTEHGIADLRGLTLAQRARRMIAIAAPEQRAALEAALTHQRLTS